VLTAYYIDRETTQLGVRSISTQVGKGSCNLWLLCSLIHWKGFLVTITFLLSIAVRNRMKSVKNIQKITKAMKMVAASKLRAVQTRTENSRGLWQPFTALLGDAPSMYTYIWGFQSHRIASFLVSFTCFVLCRFSMMRCFSGVLSVTLNTQ